MTKSNMQRQDARYVALLLALVLTLGMLPTAFAAEDVQRADTTQGAEEPGKTEEKAEPAPEPEKEPEAEPQEEPKAAIYEKIDLRRTTILAGRAAQILHESGMPS